MSYVILCIVLFCGLYSFFTLIFKLPINSVKKAEKRKPDVLKFILILFPSGMIDTIRIRLNLADSEETAEAFIYRLIVRMIPMALLLLFMVAFRNFYALPFPVIGEIIIFTGFMNTLKRQSESRKRMIVEELPEMMSYLTNSLKHSKDLATIIQNYLPASGRGLEKELQLLLADLKTGNTDEALFGFDMRLNIPHLSNYISIVRAAMEGETQISTLEAITIDMEHYEYEMAKKRAKETPDKVFKATFAVGSMVLIYFAVLMFDSIVIGMKQY